MSIRQTAYVVLVVAIAGCKEAPVSSPGGKTYPALTFTEKRPTVGDKQWYLCWGETNDGLAFVLFEDATPVGGHGISSATNSRGVNEGWLLKPDGTKAQLPTDAQLHEVIGGKYREREGRVTKDQLNAFLDSKPKEYTIDALLRFVLENGRSSATSRPG